jgi:hypothetical protein
VDAGAWTFLFGYVAGALSTLSPCVVPLVPILIASALAQPRRLGAALGSRRRCVVGVFVATVGSLGSMPMRWIARWRRARRLWRQMCQRACSAASRRDRGLGARRRRRLACTHGSGWRGQLAVAVRCWGSSPTRVSGDAPAPRHALLAQGRRLGEVALLMLVLVSARRPLVVTGARASSLFRKRGTLARRRRWRRVASSARAWSSLARRWRSASTSRSRPGCSSTLT